MKRLDRYIYGELAVPIFIGTIFVALMFQANEMIALFKNLNMSMVPPKSIAQYLIYKMPEYLVFTLPMGAAIGASLAISRLGRESELTAMRAAGVSVLRILRPVVIAGILIGVANWSLAENLVPGSSKEAKRILNQASILAVAQTFRADVMLKIQPYQVFIGSARKQGRNMMVLEDILLVERRPAGEVLMIIAPSGRYIDGRWVVEKPTTFRVQAGNLTTMTSKENLFLNQPIQIADFFDKPEVTEQTAGELRKAIESGKKMNQDTLALEVGYYVKYAVPASCLVFGLTGAAMAMVFSRSGPFVGTLMSMVCCWLYFNLYIISTEVLGKFAYTGPFIAAWAPNIIFFIIAVIAIRRCE